MVACGEDEADSDQHEADSGAELHDWMAPAIGEDRSDESDDQQDGAEDDQATPGTVVAMAMLPPPVTADSSTVSAGTS